MSTPIPMDAYVFLVVMALGLLAVVVAWVLMMRQDR